MNARRWRRYPAYRDPGVDWLGKVPSHWDVLALKRVVSMRSGEAITSSQIEENGDYPVFGGNGIRGFTDRFTHEGSFVLVGRQGALCGNVNYASGKFWASEHAVVCTPLRKMPLGWLGELLETMNLGQYSVAAAQPGISVDAVSRVKAPVPPLSEQRAIAAFLDRETARIDALIAKKEELIRLLEEKRASVMSQVVTRGLTSSGSTVDSGIPAFGAVPAHWRVVRNKNILRTVQDPSPDGSEELLTVSHITGVTPRTEKDVTMFLAESNVGYPRVAPGDLVINTMWAWMGALGVARHHGIVSPAYGVYRFTDAGVLPEYYDVFYRTAAYVTEMTRFSTGVWSSRLRIYPDVFLSLRVVVPPVDEQRAILDHIATATGDTEAVLGRLAASVALLREQRQALITAAITGQIDVRDEATA